MRADFELEPSQPPFYPALRALVLGRAGSLQPLFYRGHDWLAAATLGFHPKLDDRSLGLSLDHVPSPRAGRQATAP